MAINKVIYGDDTLIDLTSDTVTADKLLSGYTAHAANGEMLTGTYTPSAPQWGDITGTLSNQTDLQTALDSKFDEPATAGTEGQVLAMTSSSEYGWTTIKDANVTYTNVRSETKTLDYVIDSFYFGSRYPIPSGGWVSGTVINNVTYYTYTLNLGRTLNSPSPVIGLQAGSGTLPTEAERRAYNTFDFAFADTNNNSIIFYSRRRPSSTFYVTILGVL